MYVNLSVDSYTVECRNIVTVNIKRAGSDWFTGKFTASLFYNKSWVMSIISNSKTVLNERIYWEPRLWADNVFILLLIIKKCKSSSLLRRAGENIPQIQAKTEAKIWSQQLHPFNGAWSCWSRGRSSSGMKSNPNELLMACYLSLRGVISV